jgi:hypothetical protein
MRIVSSTALRSYPVGKSDVFVGGSDATPGYPVGRRDRELLDKNYYLQIASSLYPTLFFT